MTTITDEDIDGGWRLTITIPDGRTMTTTDVEPLVPKVVGRCERVDCTCRCSACRKDELWESA